MNRTIIFTLCTLLSFAGLVFTVVGILNYDPKLFYGWVKMVIPQVIAWLVYFWLGFNWIRNKKTSKLIIFLGTISALYSIYNLFFVPALFVLPAILISLYIIYFSISQKESEIEI